MGKDHRLDLGSILQLKSRTGMLTLTFPNLFEIDEARSIETAAIMLVTKKRDPSFPSCKSNLSLKKYVTHDLYFLLEMPF